MKFTALVRFVLTYLRDNDTYLSCKNLYLTVLLLSTKQEAALEVGTSRKFRQQNSSTYHVHNDKYAGHGVAS